MKDWQVRVLWVLSVLIIAIGSSALFVHKTLPNVVVLGFGMSLNVYLINLSGGVYRVKK